MKRATTIIIGAGQAGLAMSRCLSDRSIDHVILERGEVANSWRTERWDSLRLLTPNWQSRLPGYSYTGPDPDGFMNMSEVTGFLTDYARCVSAPVLTRTRVTCVRPSGTGYRVATNRGQWQCRFLVIASGACNIASAPRTADLLPASIEALTPLQYRNPQTMPDGPVMVVGASATGVQLASELQASGRQVILSVGEHVRVPRTYRGRDIKWWMDRTGVLDAGLADVDDIGRARRVPSLQLIGSAQRSTIDLNSLQSQGVELVGRFAGLSEGKALFSGSLRNHCDLADLKMNRLLDGIDEWIDAHDMTAHVEPAHRFDRTRVAEQPRLGIDLAGGAIRSVIWATGYRPDYSWLQVPVFDRKGGLRHQGGVVDAPGMYVLGLPFLRRRKSSLIDGVGDDARDLADHLSAQLQRAAA